MQDTLQQDFILELYRLCLHDGDILQVATQYLKQNFLPEKVEQKFLEELKHQSELQNVKPTFGTLKQAFRKDREMLDYTELVKNTELRDSETILKSLEDYIKQGMFIQAYDEVAEIYNKKSGNKVLAYRTFSKKAEELNNFSLTENLFEPIFGNFRKRHVSRIMEAQVNHSKMPTGIDELDYVTKGGPELGDFILYMGEAKSGKSFLLTHHGVNYARKGYKVAHIQAEGTKKQVEARYDSAWTGSLYHEIKNGQLEDDKFEKYERVVDNIGDGEIFVYTSKNFNSLNMVQIRQKVIDLIKKHDIKVVIIDYLDLINPDEHKYGPADERHRQQKTAQSMKDLAKELNVLVISATQTTIIHSDTRKDADFVITREHLAEDKGKVRPVDWLISINKSREERRNNDCRLYLDAIREHDSDITINIKQNLSRSRFYDRKRTLTAGLFSTDDE